MTGPSAVDARLLRGLARLAADGVVGVADAVDRMHHAAARRTGFVRASADGRNRGLTGAIYGLVRGTARVAGGTLDAALEAVLGSPAGDDGAAPRARDDVIAALNGIWGDHLEASGNPLAIPMALRLDGRALPLARDALAARLPGASPHVVVFAHGLGMHDGQWLRGAHDHGAALARDTGCTSVYLHYNSGRHVSANGREFARLLERLLTAWPVPVAELTIVGYSMGGLVARSACDAARAARHRWPSRLRRLVFVGTPHHGALLEQGGNLADAALAFSDHSAPLAGLTRARSAGITDLRYGNLRDEDWARRARHAQSRDDRRPVPLPRRARTYVLAGTKSARRGALRDRLVGDGVVPLPSALGDHPDPALALGVPDARRRIVTGVGHLDLLGDARVYEQLRRWIAGEA